MNGHRLLACQSNCETPILPSSYCVLHCISGALKLLIRVVAMVICARVGRLCDAGVKFGVFVCGVESSRRSLADDGGISSIEYITCFCYCFRRSFIHGHRATFSYGTQCRSLVTLMTISATPVMAKRHYPGVTAVGRRKSSRARVEPRAAGVFRQSAKSRNDLFGDFLPAVVSILTWPPVNGNRHRPKAQHRRPQRAETKVLFVSHHAPL